MNYLFLGLSVLCIGFQFVFTKYYQSRAGKGFLPAVLFNVAAGAVSCLLFACLGGFRLQINAFSASLGAAFAVAMTAINCIGIFAMSCGKVSVYTLFMMLGGMLLPFIYGLVFLNEKAGVCRDIALVLIVAAMVIPCMNKSEEKSKKRFYIFCVFAFVLNGAISVISKAHQISSHAVSTYSFLAFAYGCVCVLSGVICSVYLLVSRLKRKSTGFNEEVACSEQESGVKNLKKSADTRSADGKKKILILSGIFAVAYAASNGLCNLFQMLGARSLPAVLLYPVTTGGSIVLTAILGRIFFKEKITKQVAMSIALAFAATVLFLF